MVQLLSDIQVRINASTRASIDGHYNSGTTSLEANTYGRQVGVGLG